MDELPHPYPFIGDRIADLRLYHRLTQHDLARAMKVSPNTVSRWETAVYRPQADDLYKLALYFKVPISRFFPPDVTLSEDRLREMVNEAIQAAARFSESLMRVVQ